ncbi:hypothetical protein FQJ95_07490 [Xanthomonas vasicola]|uniref:Uncharacterized protein n=1 Tax=Xanthomonas vasicola TaxID=56459 RepID=A0ABD7S432_XANVA|nr:hypothetical protein FQJ97_22370 [Xanthomonas vasicola]TWQ43188.1 hypothetical protein FQK01_25160 [Xanthomonas vasicola]TWQ51744.1 hypothetical protein FQJ93_22345 [Xanthomonas vasicola]TWQ64900.1 hypothetical protein FQJ91_21550 [Xanthomonas vasicola]TWR01188.1 hypothetical protein FQJ87_20940 [Xanthomonas vasicola]
MRVKLRGDPFFQKGQRHAATHAMRQLVVVCHRHAQARIVVASDSVGLTELLLLVLSLRL